MLGRKFGLVFNMDLINDFKSVEYCEGIDG
jgi:hypothetical protein